MWISGTVVVHQSVLHAHVHDINLNINLMCSPMGFYFVSGSHDRSARVWSTDHIQPIRILAGHLSDIDVSVYEITIQTLIKLLSA